MTPDNVINLRWKLQDRGNQYVEFIKTLRAATGWGVKEAMNFDERLYINAGVVHQIKVKAKLRNSLINDFKKINNLETF